MDTQVVHPQHEGEEVDHHEKKSVFKKVRAKAKKLKETITGQGHGNDLDQVPGDDHDLDEEDDQDVDNPEVHGSPMYDSSRKTEVPVQGDISKETSNGGAKFSANPMKDHVPGQNRNSGHDDLLGGAMTKQAGPTTGSIAPQNTPVSSIPRENYSTTMGTEPSKTHASGQGVHSGQSGVLNHPVVSVPEKNYNTTMGTEQSRAHDSSQGGHLGQSGMNLDHPQAPEADPLGASNYESKTIDPTRSGGQETGITPILHSFDKMKIDEGTEKRHDDQDLPKSSTGSHDQFSPEKPSNQTTSYTDKISFATSAIAGRAISAKNVVASKLGYGGNNEQQGQSRASESSSEGQEQFKPTDTQQDRGTIPPDHHTSTDQKPVSPTGGGYMSSATSAIAGTAASAKNAVASKLGYGGSNEQQGHEQLKPETDQKPPNQTSYMSSATSAAVSAKNAVASKLGYGGSGTDQVHDSGDVNTTRSAGSAAPVQQGKGITTSVTEKLSPVYQKVTVAGGAVISKIKGGGATRESSGGVDQAMPDKGATVKDYFSEKLKPGEEDRALSEVISETLRKPGVKKETVGSPRPVGKVTESPEVTERLGGAEGNENFVVNRIEESVGSMIGGGAKKEEQDHGHVVDQRRLQESGN